MWNIGDIEIKNRVVLAPMAGVSNSGFRRIIKDFGCGLIYAEMVSDKAIYYGNKKTIDMLYMKEEERPIAQQIFGSDKESFVVAAKYIYENMKPDIIDINMGCPVPKVALRAQAGSALLKDLDKIKEVVTAVVSAVPIPVTVKIRSGWDFDSVNAVEVAKVIESSGASAITVHARTRSQGYSGKADLDVIKAVKEAVLIPVIGNGDITTPDDAKHMLDYTKCDAVMIGRGVLGNPWLIEEVVNYLEDKPLPNKPKDYEKVEMCILHLNNLLEFKDEKQALMEIRTHVAWYLKGIDGANDIKRAIFKLKEKSDIIDVLTNYMNNLKEG